MLFPTCFPAVDPMTTDIHTQQQKSKIWKRYTRARHQQVLAGKTGAIFLCIALLLLVDGLVALMRTDTSRIDLLAGETASISGPLAVEAPVQGDVEARFIPGDTPLRFEVDGFFAGHWFGNGMWRGVFWE